MCVRAGHVEVAGVDVDGEVGAGSRAEEGRGPPVQADDAGPSVEKKRRQRHDHARRVRGDGGAAAVDDDGGIEMSSGIGRKEKARIYSHIQGYRVKS